MTISYKVMYLHNFRTSAYKYSTEEKAAVSDDKQPPSSIEECHKQIENLTNELGSVKEQIKDYDVRYLLYQSII